VSGDDLHVNDRISYPTMSAWRREFLPASRLEIRAGVADDALPDEVVGAPVRHARFGAAPMRARGNEYAAVIAPGVLAPGSMSTR
jgi:hypothetical protein